MKPYKKTIGTLPDELIHNHTTHRKRLIWVDEKKKGDIATMNYAWLTPGKQLDIHRHDDGEEYYYFLEGCGRMLVGADWFTVGPGEFVTVPKQHDHSVQNTGTANLVFLTVRTVEHASD